MKKPVLLLIISFIALLAVMFILPFFSLPGYSLVTHTTSQLGAQSTPNAWVMNATFILLGASSIIAGWKVLQPYFLVKVFLIAFGMGLVGSGIFHHTPIDETLPADLYNDKIHSAFATITGIAFTILAVGGSFVMDSIFGRYFSLFIGIAAALLSYSMFQYPSYMGLLQRTMLILSFGWMIWFFNVLEKIAPPPSSKGRRSNL